MKRFFRPRHGVLLLFLVALATTLTYRAAVPRAGFLDYSQLQVRPEDFHLLHTLPRSSTTSSSPVNSTLLRLASVDVGEPELRKEVEDLVDGGFAFASDRRYRSISAWRRFHHLDDRDRRLWSARSLPIRFPRDNRAFPVFRRALRDWSRRRRFRPGIMSELVELVKRPVDLHYAGLRSEDPVSGSISGGSGPPTRRYSSCAVVGNSGILMREDRGDLIDGHELVIRLNNARKEGYHRNVGSKTGLSFVNSNILHLCARRQTCFCHPYGEQVPIIMYICQAMHFLDYAVCNASHKAPLLVTDPQLDLLCARIVKYYSLKRFVEETGKAPEEWDKAHDPKMFHYSSGMQAVMLAVGICDRVSVFGFGKSAEAKHHYHTNQKAELSLHDYEAEYALYRDLVERPQGTFDTAQLRDSLDSARLTTENRIGATPLK
ncbi:hypothetical protein Taro_008481 [Colocasia esculenta]|uniref:Sialyltransferase-like protein 1 n=1 Tax=Colocasia esculenta TaxID=4460 RepID=A0A843TXA5_COLES|nr:hypothetical protein [Colocasia esculenta]